MAKIFPSSSSFLLLLLVALILPSAHQLVLSQLINITAITRPVTTVDRLRLPAGTIGPDTTAFDRSGGGPYVSVAGGRVLKFSGPSTGFVDFAVTPKNRSSEVCDSANTMGSPQCGRPLGIEFYNKTGTLYIADGYLGLLSVGPGGGVATLLASSAEGVPFKLTDGLGVDDLSGNVYFTDASSRFNLGEALLAILTVDRSGRLLKYDPATKQVTVLLRDLGGPAGVAVSKDGRFLLVTEILSIRIQRYWLKGPKANTAEIFYIPPGPPDNIRRNPDGNFWVAVATSVPAGPLGILLNEEGQVLRVLSFATAGITEPISNLQESHGRLYIGSLLTDYVGVTNTTA